MNRKVLILGLGLLSLGLGGCKEDLRPEQFGLKVQRYGDAQTRGIQNAEVVQGGTVWYNSWSEDVIPFSSSVKTYPFTQSSDEGSPIDESTTVTLGGSQVSFDFGVSIAFTAEGVRDYYTKFTKEPDAFIKSDLRRILRECAVESGEEMRLTAVTLVTRQTPYVRSIQRCMQERLSTNGKPFVLVDGVSILNSPRFDPGVQEAINAQIVAEQATQTARERAKREKAEAEANRAKAEGEAAVLLINARAEAMANRIRSSSITPELLQRERIAVERARVEKWNGISPAVVNAGNANVTGGVVAE